MLTRILHNSTPLCTFLDKLNLDLSQPQRRHLCNLTDALLVCEDKKTLAALQRQFVEAPDASNMADFLRISPWQAEAVRAALRAHQVAWLLAEAERTGAAKAILSEMDHSLKRLETDYVDLNLIYRLWGISERKVTSPNGMLYFFHHFRGVKRENVAITG
jgi:hypothetical protein